MIVVIEHIDGADRLENVRMAETGHGEVVVNFHDGTDAMFENAEIVKTLEE